MNHSFQELKQHCLTISTRSFQARGSSVIRCHRCHLAQFACICPWLATAKTDLEFIIVMHRKEVFKTTNSGRLLGDVFSDHVHYFLWDRTEPSLALLSALNNNKRNVCVLFPESEESEESQKDPETKTSSTIPTDSSSNKPTTIVLLDGTWKQASRMIRLSPWLQNLPRVSINPETHTQTYIRKTRDAEQLSTAQAAACILEQYGESIAAEVLRHYFFIFNQHCVATRRNITPEITPSHQFLKARQQ